MQKNEIQKIYINIQRSIKMKAIIDKVLSSPTSIPPLPRNLTPKDAQMLQSAVSANMQHKDQSNILRTLLAATYRQLNNDKCLRVITEINSQNFSEQLQIESKLIICDVINNSFDNLKADMVKSNIIVLNAKSSINEKQYKYKLDIVKAGYEALKQNYYKAAIGFVSASKDQMAVEDELERVNLIQKAIGMCLLAQKTPELHQLICQLYVNPLTQKSPCHNLVNKMYSQSMIDVNDMEPIRALMSAKFDKKDSDNISTLNKVIFKHNMSPIINCFENISIQSLAKLFGIKQDDLLIMIQKSFDQKDLEVDQISGYLYIKRNHQKDQTLIRNLFDHIQQLISRSQK